MSEKKRSSYLKDSWLVILLALLYGGGLAGVNTALKDRIAENKRNETYSVIPLLVEGAESASTVELMIQNTKGKSVRVYKAVNAAGAHAGWVIPASGQGFADRIELLIGLNADLSTITGLYILDQKETPGLGNYITSEDFQNQFAGKPADQPIKVVKKDPKGASEILALTGATISSESVSGIVNKTVQALRDPIRQHTEQEK